MNLEFLLVIFWFLFFIFLHIWLFYLGYIRFRARVIIYSFLGSIFLFSLNIFLVYSLINGSSVQYSQLCFNIFLGIAMMCCLFVLYMPFFYTISSSLSVDTILRIYRNKQQKSVNELQEFIDSYTSSELILGRLSLMVSNGYLVKIDNKYYLSKKGRSIAVFFQFIKRLWNLGTGG